MTSAARTLAILFADIGGSTALYEEVGDVEAHRRVAESLAFMKTAVERHAGSVLRTVGDATLASFECCDDACLAACAMQRLHVDGPLSVRVGFHVGPVIPDGGDVYGNAVNVAARIASFARTDEIVASEDAVRALSAAHRERATLLDTREMKGLARPLAIHRLVWQEARDTAPVTVIAAGARSTEPGEARGRLELVRGGVRVTLDARRPTLSIGRGESCDLTVDDPHASRSHARLELVRGQFLLLDESTNGTWLLHDARAPILVRRDTVVLDGAGRLGLGASPTDGEGSVPIAFRVETDEPRGRSSSSGSTLPADR